MGRTETSGCHCDDPQHAYCNADCWRIGIEHAARDVVEAEGPSTKQRTDFWAAVDRLREVFDAKP